MTIRSNNMGRKPNLEARTHILDVACQLIHENGFNGISVDQVAEAAGVKKANLFHYYPSKEALGLAVFEYTSLRYKECVAGHFAQEVKDPIAAVEKLFTETAECMRRNNCTGGCFVGNLAQELSDHNERLRERIADYFQYWTQQLSGLLDRWRARGYFKAELDVREASEAIVSLYEGALLCCKARKQVSSLESARKMATRYLVDLKA